MPREFDDKKLNLGEPLASKVRDFRAANYNAPVMNIIREALDEHIERRLESPEMRERFDAARRRRLSQPQKIVQMVKKDS